MPAIAATRHEVSDRFEVLGFTVKTGRQPYFEIALASDPALFQASRKSQRATSNFYSTRAAGPLLAERGEAVFLVPPEILKRFVGQPRLYYAVATFADAGRGQPEVGRVPTEASPWINLGAFTGRSNRRTMSLRSYRQGRPTTGNGYGTSKPEELEWAGDAPRPGAEPIAPASPEIAPGSDTAKAPPPQAGTASGFTYDDGFGPLSPRPLEATEAPEEAGIEGPIGEEEMLAQGMGQARAFTDTPEYPGASRFIAARWFSTPKSSRTISRIVIHITDGQAQAENTARYFQDPMRWLAIDVENGELQVEREGDVVKRFRSNNRWKDCVNGKTKIEGQRTKGLARVAVSAHYVVGQDGEVIQMVKHAHVAYHAGTANTDSIGIEHNARTPGAFGTNDAGLYPTEEQYRASARLVCWLARECSVPKDRTHILGHAEADPNTSHTACPNAVWDWELFMRLVTDGSCDPAPAAATAAYRAGSGRRQPAGSFTLRSWPPRSHGFSRGPVAVHWNDVQLVPQMTNMSCWAASAAMVVGWRDRISIDPSEIARGAGQWAAYKNGLNPNHRDELAAAWGLQTEPPQNYTIEGFGQLLQTHGPLWIGVAVPSGHAVVVTGLEGDGTPDGTFVRYHDPWPPGQGAAGQTKSYRTFMTEYENRLTTDDSGAVNVQILHAGGAGGRQPATAVQAMARPSQGQRRAWRARPFGGQSFTAYWNDVQLVPQMTNMSCWAASAAMVVGWRDQISIDPSEIARGAGEWAAYKKGLSPNNVDELATAWGLRNEGPQSYTIEGFRRVLEANGPLWIGVAVPSGHAVVVTGLYGDGSPDDTFVRYHDPWPPGQGAAGQIKSYRQFMQEYERMASTDPAGNVNVLILHAGGTGGRSVAAGAQALGAPRPFVRSLSFSAFAGDAVERMRQEFVANVSAGSPRSCIVITNAGLRQLFGAALKNPDGTDKRLGTTIQDTMAALQSYGLAQGPRVFEFSDAQGRLTKGVLRPDQLRESVEGWLLSESGAVAQSAWHVFGLSIMDGYHSVVLALDSSGTGHSLTRLFWADQIYSGWDDVTGALDARITERTQRWWDPLPSDRKARTRVTLWPLMPGPASVAPPLTQARTSPYAFRSVPTRARPFETEGEDGIEGMEEESALVSKPQESGECTDAFCPAREAATAGSTHFSIDEFTCRDGTKVPEKFRGNVQEVMDNLEILRAELGQPITITSGYRTCSYNGTLEGAASRSRHLCAQAADIRVAEHTPEQVHSAIERLIAAGRMRQGGLGLYNTFVHYDVRGTSARWDRRTSASKGLAARGLDHVPGHVLPDYSQVSGFSQAAGLFFDWLLRGLRFSIGVPNTRFFPHSAICKIRAVDGAARVLGHGSGFYIGPNKVLTAGHVLWNTGLITHGFRAEAMEIVPGLNGTEEPFGGASVMGSAATFHPSYNPASYNPSFDLAVIHSAPDAPNGEYFEMEELRMSPMSGIITCGYAGVDVDRNRQHLDVDTIRQLHNGTFSYAAQVRQGSSGGPVFYSLDAQTIRVVGLNVTTLDAHENRGLRLTDDLIRWINSI